MTNRREKENKSINIEKILGNKVYIALGIIILFILILVIGSNVSSPETKIQSTEISKEAFVELKNSIELKVANLMLDGTVTDDNSMKEKIEEINNLLEKEKWDKLGIISNEEFDGTWSLDENGMVKFKFNNALSKPSWATDVDITEHIIKN